MPEFVAGVPIPETDLVREATEIVQQAADRTLFDHSRRVYLWGSLKAAARGMDLDPELAYVGSLFHDLGLVSAYANNTRRFELDGAEAARISCCATAVRSRRPAMFGSRSHCTPLPKCHTIFRRRWRW
ncbi:hypothetical protein B7C42_06194 [Nocardia cerradoensis]|uniref:HD domain-containing protein n=1 Tax=Nocardia cerradoensis TaxID=85688 RepID=A0A231GZ51_9NOCA|nr:hypothetical protein B7C42_06194 [Nocardia cerradoensis]